MSHEEDRIRQESEQTVLDLFKVPKLRCFTFAIYYISFSGAFVYYSFTYNAADMGGSLHWNMFLQALADLVKMALMLYIVDKFDRRKLALFFNVCALCIIFGMIPFTFGNYMRIQDLCDLNLLKHEINLIREHCWLTCQWSGKFLWVALVV